MPKRWSDGVPGATYSVHQARAYPPGLSLSPPFAVRWGPPSPREGGRWGGKQGGSRKSSRQRDGVGEGAGEGATGGCREAAWYLHTPISAIMLTWLLSVTNVTRHPAGARRMPQNAPGGPTTGVSRRARVSTRTGVRSRLYGPLRAPGPAQHEHLPVLPFPGAVTHDDSYQEGNFLLLLGRRPLLQPGEPPSQRARLCVCH